TLGNAATIAGSYTFSSTLTASINGSAPAGSLTGSTLAAGVTASSLTSVGTLGSLAVSGVSTFGNNIRVSAVVEVQRYSGSAYLATMFFTNLNNTNAMSNMGGGSYNGKGDALAIGNAGGNHLSL